MNRPISDLSTINLLRLTILTPYLIGIAYIMFALSLLIREIKPLQIALGILMVGTTFTQVILIVLRPEPGEPLRLKHTIIVDLFSLMLLLWGATMIGYQPNSAIPYFDYLVTSFSIGIVFLVSAKKLLSLYAISTLYLFFLTPVLKLTTTNNLLLISSIILFTIFSFIMSYLFNRQFLDNLKLASQLFDHQLNLTELVREKTAEVLATQNIMAREVIRVLAKVLDDFDSYTRGHSENVAHISERMALKMGLAEEFQQQLYWAGMIHDVGKIRIPKQILNKTTQLTSDELAKIRQHSIYGYEMIHESETLRPLAQIILSHHERFDGTGHPNQLKGDQIPLAAQILSIADTWDAMLSRRVYRDALSVDHAIAELIRSSGKQFAPGLVNTFLLMIEEEPELQKPQNDHHNQ